MKNILKNALGTVLGIFLFMFIVTMVVFIVNFMFLTSNKNIKITKNSILEIKLDLPFKDNMGSSNTLFSNSTEISLKKLINAIENATIDNNIKGISLEINNLRLGITQIKDIRYALEKFKKSNKFIYAYGEKYTQNAYYLSSIANLVYLNPFGNIDFRGLGMEIQFYKKLTDTLGITFFSYKKGRYKSAIEPYIRNKMSYDNKQQSIRILNSVWINILQEISISRNISIKKLNQIADELSGMIAQSSLKNRLVDKLAYYDEFIIEIRKKLNIYQNEKLSIIPISDYINNIEYKKYENNIALFYASGTITQGDGNQEIQDNNYKRIIENIKNDNSIKAVVLRINSPGGDAIASANIYHELIRLKKYKPLIISLGDEAASGGYYIALSGDDIIASPISIVGSIGVFGLLPSLNIFSHKIGITNDSIGTNKNSNTYSIFNGVNSQYKKIMFKNIENIYNNFKNIVSERRNISIEKIESIAQGQLWTGKEALDIGLIDRFGNIDDAIKIAASKAKIKTYNIIEYPKQKSWIDVINDIYSEENIKEKVKIELILEYLFFFDDIKKVMNSFHIIN